MKGKLGIINKATNCSTKPMHGLLKHICLLSEGKYLNNTKPLHGLWISVFPVNSSGSVMQEFLWEMHAFVSVFVDEYRTTAGNVSHA